MFHTPFRKYFFSRYSYNFTPPQLCFLCQCIEETKELAGCIAEVGCATGVTTIFLNRYMNARKIEKQYFAIDTFSGFTSEDVEFEITKREKDQNLFTGFQVNKKKWFDAAMHHNDITRVISIETDVNKFDLTGLGSVAFALLDVDLYRPTRKSLTELHKVLSPGGIMVVDDCDPQNLRWDGSEQAYREYLMETDQPAQVVHGKLGVVRKAN
jgi:SAM-dependent methyltransferase